MKLYDISRTVTPAMAPWPGDTPYSHRWVMRMDAGDAVNVSTLTMSAHTGAHVDSPYHYAEEGMTLAEMPLDIYIGPATVIEINTRGEILPKHFDGVALAKIERLLIKTPASQRPNDVWWNEFAHLSPAAAELLGRNGLRLFGTDAPSVDPVDSKTMDAHRMLYRYNVAILENALLLHVPPGEYELIALPLKIPTDGSPVRAVLRGRLKIED